jgi:hypothetical protein
MVPATNEGIIARPSNHSVDQTLEALKNILQLDSAKFSP